MSMPFADVQDCLRFCRIAALVMFGVFMLLELGVLVKAFIEPDPAAPQCVDRCGSRCNCADRRDCTGGVCETKRPYPLP
jgi:hypothetical protein